MGVMYPEAVMKNIGELFAQMTLPLRIYFM